MNAITVKHITKKIGTATIIPDLSLEVPSGAIYGFLGPNGAGKTTTIRLLLGLIRPDSGSITVVGQSFPVQRRTILERVGSLVEGPSLYPHLSGVDNLRILALARSVSQQRVDEALAIVGLSDAAHKLAGHYSLGMKQRLGIAIALLHKPSLLILDEPVNGLDPAGIRDLRQTIISLQRDHNMTIFLSSHLLSEVEHIATHIGIIDHGQLLFEGSKEELQAHSCPQLEIVTSDSAATLTVVQRLGLIAEVDESGVVVREIADEQVAQIVQQLTKNDINIYQLRRVTADLESIFMELTNNQEKTV